MKIKGGLPFPPLTFRSWYNNLLDIQILPFLKGVCMKIYHLADLHLGVNPPLLGEREHTRITLRKLDEVISKAQKEGVKFIVFAGDIFDSNALPTSLAKEFFELLARNQGLYFVLLPGGGQRHEDEISGHDAYTRDSLYHRLEIRSYFEHFNHLKLLTPEQPVALFREEGVAFYGGFFDLPRTTPQTEARFHVAVMHGAFGERRDFGEVNLASEKTLFYDYLALGHYHRFKPVTEKAAYSGAFVQFEFLPYKDGTSGYLEVELSSSPLRLQYHTFEDAPRFIYHRVFSDKDLELLRRLDSNSYQYFYVKIVSYLQKFEQQIKSFKERWGERIQIGAEAPIRKEESSIFVSILEEILRDKVPEEYRREVEEFLLYGLLVSYQKAHLERFLKHRFLTPEGQECV